MHRARFSLSIASLLIGASIVFVSLTAVSPVISSETSASHRKFYVDDPNMPDHVAYPLIMVADRVALEVATPEERIELQLEYGLRRMEYARQMLEKGDSSLAITTLTKSQKYVIQAAQEALTTDASRELKEKVLKVLIRYCEETTAIADQFSDADRVAVNHLIDECEALQLRLRESLLHS
jgi:hypothetical protein